MRRSALRRLFRVVLVAGLVLGVPAAGAGVPASRHDPGEVRDMADEILARDEFQPPPPSLLERVFDWIGDHLTPGDSNSGGSGSEVEAGAPGAGGSSVLTTIALVLAIAGVGWAAWVLLRQPRRRRRVEEAELPIEVEEHRGAREWTDAAAGFEAEGRWKDGLRCRFRALLERLTDAAVVPEIAGRTTGEFRADVEGTLPEAAADFTETADLFDRAWYGDLATGPEEARRFAAAADRVLTRVGERVR